MKHVRIKFLSHCAALFCAMMFLPVTVRGEGTGPGQYEPSAVKAGDGLSQCTNADMRAVVAGCAQTDGCLLHEHVQSIRRKHGMP